ncbi:DUF6909 family protein [Anaerolinea thermophila]|uniref:Uncharacterized protein n=1 Tax=Anaerolinea thermophila (strain DSM 14523 / JCM 11388 / NBRC 100420 / UNI-1) TaxID=926569 RepID=E8N109_ANATU|nr:hypothetical protein [Anaerolinea thermophila]BAJ62554.1 hypothetical protein ANT_05200 [Anaerolinea thermophila UNI-1]
MERTVPSATSEEIKLYRATLYSLLRSTAEVSIRTLEEAHAGMNSLLHPHARDSQPDLSAFIYAMLRLPDCMPEVRSVILGQSQEVFQRHGYGNIETWQEVSARARRRRCFFDGQGTLACYIASRSDIEDILPALTAYQIEWNKMRLLLSSLPEGLSLEEAAVDPQRFLRLADALRLTVEDLGRLRTLWGSQFAAMLERIRAQKMNLGVRLLSGSLSAYQRATHLWWEHLESVCSQLGERPLYFISSNTHSLANLLSGYALRHEDEIARFIEQSSPELKNEWRDIQQGQVRSSRENFLYYALKKYQQSMAGAHSLHEQLEEEQSLGILRIPSERSFDLEAQVIDLSRLDPSRFDPRLQTGLDLTALRQSNALILNIDYPLGLAAYHLLSKIAEQAIQILGVYIMGKAATLNARRGDVMIPSVVQDEHSHNTYLFRNCFTAADVTPYLVYGSVLDNQKAVCVLGTFLQNARIMDVFYREGYADIEMEAGPYLSAVYEMSRPKRHPVDELVNLSDLPFDLGILHYASDTPLSKGQNLGAGTLSYYGMDSTYATTIAIARRIFQQEILRLG